MPYISRKTLTFGVSIPAAVYNDERLKKLRKSFSLKVIISGLVIIAVSVIPFFVMEQGPAISVMSALVFVYLFIILPVYLSGNKEVKRLKQELGWDAGAAQKVVGRYQIRLIETCGERIVVFALCCDNHRYASAWNTDV